MNYGNWILANAGPLTDYTIGIDTIENMISKIKEKPWPIYKIKLGTPDDMSIMKALREQTQMQYFGLMQMQAGRWMRHWKKFLLLKELGVEFIEQPLAKDDWEGMKILFRESSLPLIADESCVHEQDVEKCQSVIFMASISNLPNAAALHLRGE